MNKPFLIVLMLVLLLGSCDSRHRKDGLTSARAEIDRILRVQDDAYDAHSEEGRRVLASTCVDSLIFIGGDNGGQATTAEYYVHDLADGYSVKPHDRTYRIFEQTAIVTSMYQSYKVFHRDTIYFNARSTKVFVKTGDGWKMAFVTYAPVPVIYNDARAVSTEVLQNYVGAYATGDGTADTVSLVGNSLWIGQGKDKSQLFPLNDSIFFSKDYFGHTGFAWRGGRVTHSFYEFPDGQRLIFRRVSAE